MVDTLLKQWRDYMNSPEYKQEQDRARKDRSQEDKNIEVDAKVKVYSLRHQRRRCRMLKKKLDQGLISEVRPDDQDLYWRFIDGRLGKDIDEATRKHGYGTLSTGQRIGAFGPKFG